MARLDVQSAFRLLPVYPDDFSLLGSQLEGKSFVEKMAPMGAQISCALWESFGHMLEWLITSSPRFHGQLQRYLYAIFCAFPTLASPPSDSIAFILEICAFIGFPLAGERHILHQHEQCPVCRVADTTPQEIRVGRY